MSTLNIKLADGNEIISYEDDTSYIRGCETCDYGSKYINEITIITTHFKIEVTFNQMYEYAFSTADAIKMFACGDFASMTEDDVIEYFNKAFHEIDEPDEFYITNRMNGKTRRVEHED